MLKDWKACAREIGRALSRYDGYSTYAKLATILSVPMSALFEDNPSCYAAELISEVEKQDVSRRVAQDHLRHGISLGFLERIISGGGIFKPESGSMKKIDETARITLSSLGRALRAANKLGLKKFRDFLITCALLDHDFDMYGLLLKTAGDNSEGKVNLVEFREQLKALLQKRKEWLDRKIPVRPIKEQICGYVPWATHQMSDTSIKHHFNMRRQWAKHLLHIDKTTELLTDMGIDLARLIATTKSRNSMFWLAPTPGCTKKVGILSKESDSVFSARDLFRPGAPESHPKEEMIQRVAEFMKVTFEIIRLRVFAQAPLAAIIPYIHFQERCLNQRVDVRATFDAVIRQNRGTFYCMLTAVPEECHYQLRARRA